MQCLLEDQIRKISYKVEVTYIYCIMFIDINCPFNISGIDDDLALVMVIRYSLRGTVPDNNEIFFIIRFYAIMHRTTIVQNKILSIICSAFFLSAEYL